MKIIERLKSPVVQIQLVSLIVAAIVFFVPEITEQVKVVSGTIIGIINVFAGLNNPTSEDSF